MTPPAVHSFAVRPFPSWKTLNGADEAIASPRFRPFSHQGAGVASTGRAGACSSQLSK